MIISKISLLYFASKKVYYECVNAILNLEKNGHWYCTCDNFHCCGKQNGQLEYCHICRMTQLYYEKDFELVKNEPATLTIFTLTIPRLIGETGEMGSFYLKDCDYFRVQ